MAEKWTKMSSPDWRWMNPNPLLALNHFTVPCSFTVFPFHLFELFGASRPPPAVQQKKAASVTRSPFISNLKVLQEQQTQLHGTTDLPLCLANSAGASLSVTPRSNGRR